MRKTLILLFVLIAGSAYTQTPGDIGTDRPDQSESPDILQPGYIQVETGGSYERYDIMDTFFDITATNTSIPTLIRIGVFPAMEIRIAPEYTFYKVELINRGFFTDTTTQKIQGFNPLTIGTKIKITDETKNIPAMAFLFNVDIPKLASKDLEAQNPTPEVRLALSKSLSDRFSLGVNLGAEFSIDYQQTVGIYTASLAADIINRLGGFIEVYGFMADHTSTLIDGGLTYLIIKNLQVDVFAGTGLTDNTPDFSFGAGLSVRLPR